jgi:hypothetical protein
LVALWGAGAIIASYALCWVVAAVMINVRQVIRRWRGLPADDWPEGRSFLL